MPRPRLRLVGPEPVGLAGRREALDRVAQAERPEAEGGHAADATERRQAGRPSVVEPDRSPAGADDRRRRSRRPCRAGWSASRPPGCPSRCPARPGPVGRPRRPPSNGPPGPAPPSQAAATRRARSGRGRRRGWSRPGRRRAPGRSASRRRWPRPGPRRVPASVPPTSSSRARVLEQHARVHDAIGIEPLDDRAQDGHPELALLGRRGTGAWSRPTPCWWLIVPPWRDERLAGRPS